MTNPNRIRWTSAQDEHIRRGRSASDSWSKIGRELGICRNSVIARGRELGLKQPIVRAVEPVVQKPKVRTMPLEAGSPETWSLISSMPFPGVGA